MFMFSFQPLNFQKCRRSHQYRPSEHHSVTSTSVIYDPDLGPMTSPPVKTGRFWKEGSVSLPDGWHRSRGAGKPRDRSISRMGMWFKDFMIHFSKGLQMALISLYYFLVFVIYSYYIHNHIFICLLIYLVYFCSYLAYICIWCHLCRCINNCTNRCISPRNICWSIQLQWCVSLLQGTYDINSHCGGEN